MDGSGRSALRLTRESGPDAPGGGAPRLQASAATPAWAKVLIVHGLGEHAGRYQPIARRWAQQGLAVEADDLAGHGEAPGRRGDAASYDQWIESVWRGMERAAGVVPLFVWGHSLGGNLVVNALLKRGVPAGVSGAILTAPMFKTAHPPRLWKRLLAPGLARWWPSFTVSTEIKPEDLSSEPQSIAAYLADPLIHHQVSARCGHGMLQSGGLALAKASQWTALTGDLPLLALHGTADRVTSLPATRQFIAAARSGARSEKGERDITLVELPQIRHEPHWDRGAADVLDRMLGWMREHASVPS